MTDFVSLIVLVLLVMLCGYLAWRAWGSKRRWLKWVGVILSGLLTLIFAVILIVVVYGTFKLNQNYNASHPVAEVHATASPEKLAWAEKYVLFCAGCHSPNQQPPLAGRDFLAPEPGAEGGGAPPIGNLYARNLTPGGELKDWSDGEIIRAIREGVHKNGRSLIVMPSSIFHNLSDEDVQAIVVYLRSQPAVTPDAPPNSLNALGVIFLAVLFPDAQTVQPHIAQPVVAPPQGATAEWGQYMVHISGCADCHGANLAGGKVGGGPPPGPNLTALVPKWNETDLVKTIRTGVDPEGHTLNPNEMPWKELSGLMSDEDLKAVYLYLHGLPTQADNPRQ
jgi:mono/diheme cytochrome c family protein